MSTVLDIPVHTIDGKPAALKDYAGNVLLVVNVASKCGLTPQYAGLEKLYSEQRAKGLQVLGFPANNFGSQEPGSNPEIAEFCSLTYGVSFPMFEKISVGGRRSPPALPSAHRRHSHRDRKAGQRFQSEAGRVWDQTRKRHRHSLEFREIRDRARDGSVAARFAPDVEPNDPLLLAAIDAELAKPAP